MEREISCANCVRAILLAAYAILLLANLSQADWGFFSSFNVRIG